MDIMHKVELSFSCKGVLPDIYKTSLVMFNLDPVVKVVFARFLHCKVGIFPFQYLIFESESLSLAYP